MKCCFVEKGKTFLIKKKKKKVGELVEVVLQLMLDKAISQFKMYFQLQEKAYIKLTC